MYQIQSWTPQHGWRDYWRQPKDIDEAKSMLSGLRATNPTFGWRAVQILDI